jgi:hypothetical protein
MAFVIEEDGPAICDSNLGFAMKSPKLQLQLIRRPEIVSIEKSNKLSLRMLQTMITGCRQSLMGILKSFQTAIMNCPDSRQRSICRTIVDHDDLEILKCLLS